MKRPSVDKATRFAIKRETADRLKQFAEDPAIIDFFNDIEAELVERLIGASDESFRAYQARVMAVRALKSFLTRAVLEGERAKSEFLDEAATNHATGHH